MNTRNTTPQDGADRLEVKAANIRKLKDQRDKALSLVKILQDSIFFSNATRRDKLDEMKRLSSSYSVRSLADAFRVPRGTYYNDVLRAKGENAWYHIRIRELTPAVIRIFAESHGAWGSEMIANKLKLEGNGADPRTVARIMNANGLVSSRNTSGRHYANERRKLENLLRKNEDQFTSPAPDKLWVCDVTELLHQKTKLYLCAIIDIFARKLVSYEIGKRNCTRLVIRTLDKAYKNRNPGKDLTFHSDRGSTNLSRRFMDHLRKLGITQSASRPHVPQDNAVIESFFRSMKAECIYPCRYKSAEDLTHGVEEWLNHYNTSRPHSFNKNKTPDQVESEFLAKLSASDDKSGALTGSI